MSEYKDGRGDYYLAARGTEGSIVSDLPVGAYVASALAAANYGGDSGEDVDNFLNQLESRGYAVVPLAVALAAEKEADSLRAAAMEVVLAAERMTPEMAALNAALATAAASTAPPTRTTMSDESAIAAQKGAS